ncbi:hypothetical protein [Sulfurirhabdus autotrophica]|uniref:Cytochrome c n=1 Tax=Sulfurirhabdus autotrophica TaxID=1706046 RepID=A0A4R3XXW4_9PROT|nr:hypothetical protein [Sulfurirhabdus autotrophica]TCV84146.1 hypothetical protein EDC63_11382 [Sulfurirhabdus autotrophica]
MYKNMKVLSCSALVGLLLSVSSVSADEKHAENHAKPADERTALVLKPDERAVVLLEMRQFLSGVQLMTDAFARDDAKALANAARSLGKAAVHEVPPALRAKLPAEFKQLGFSVHNEFDQIAMDAESMGDMKHSMTQLASTLQKCVACHTIYQIQNEPYPALHK